MPWREGLLLGEVLAHGALSPSALTDSDDGAAYRSPVCHASGLASRLCCGSGCENDGHFDTAGATYLLYGPLTADRWLRDTDVRLLGDLCSGSACHYGGYSATGFGDINGDGYGDIIAGAPTADLGATDAGRAYVWLGSPAGGTHSLHDAALIFDGEAAGDNAGSRVAGPGDLDGDGRADLLIGAPYSEANGTSAGAAYLVYGSASRGTLSLAGADLRLLGEAAGDEAGWGVARAGDVDADGHPDLLVGAPESSTYSYGAAYLFFGPLTATGDLSLGLADSVIHGLGTTGAVGEPLAGDGDTNADGYSDLIIGAGAGSAGMLLLGGAR